MLKRSEGGGASHSVRDRKGHGSSHEARSCCCSGACYRCSWCHSEVEDVEPFTGREIVLQSVVRLPVCDESGASKISLSLR